MPAHRDADRAALRAVAHLLPERWRQVVEVAAVDGQLANGGQGFVENFARHSAACARSFASRCRTRGW